MGRERLLRDVDVEEDVGSGPSADKFDKIPAISIGASRSIPIFAPMLMPIPASVFMFGPGSGSASNRDEVEADPEYSVGVELGAEEAAVARELEPGPELELDPRSNLDPGPGPSGKPCILSSPPTSSLSEEEPPTAGNCDCKRSGIQGRWCGDIVESSGRRIQDLAVSSPSSESR